MNKEKCALRLVDEVILYYDARSKKHQITKAATDTFTASSRLQFKLYYYFNLGPYYCFTLGL